MSGVLPHEARALVHATLAAARLPAREAAVVRQELESHFLDGLDAGVPIAVLAARFGDPAVTARLIREAKGRGRSMWKLGVLHAAAVAAACYVLAVARLHSAPAGEPQPDIEREARLVAELVASAEASLETPDGVRSSFAVAMRLRDRGSFWSDAGGIELLERTLAAGEGMLPCAELAALRAAVAAEAGARGLRPRRAMANAVVPRLVERIHGEHGRADRDALRLLQRTKGIAEPGAKALLLEPLYFAAARSRAEVQADVQRLVTARLTRAERAARRVEGLVRPASATANVACGAGGSGSGAAVRRADRPRRAAPAGRG